MLRGWLVLQFIVDPGVSQPTGDLPFGAVLRPETNAVFIGVMADGLVDFDDTSSQILAALSYLGVRLPLILVLP